ncbi:YfcE family phosphodiesterase [Candidatus Bathyarchaeota archaeon]|nr:MAG: YfcE family phosphodiesterase [Candidatus Bathyarchaeota archaeon]
MVRILACSDFHGNLEAASRLAEIARRERFSLILVAGDITHLGPVEAGRRIIETLLEAGRPVLHVPGNMDPPGLHEALKDLGVSLHGRGLVFEGLAFVGAGFECEGLEALTDGVRQLGGRKPDVVLTHAPPKDTKVDLAWNGSHVGCMRLAEFILKFKPRLSVCGHIHEARGTDRLGETLICNAGPASRGFYAEISREGEVNASLKRFEFG